MKLTRDDALTVRAHGTPAVNNKRHYIRYGGVWYPLPSVIWTIETGEWPKSTPRHLDGNPANNAFSNLRPPGRAKVERKTARETMAAAPAQTPVLIVYDKADQAAAAITAAALSDLFDRSIPA